MQENILLMFLSDIKFKNGEVQKTHYTNLDGEDTHATNESAVRYLLQNNSAGLSKIFIIASKTVRKNIQGCPEEITHLEYFKNRMKKFLPETENFVTVHEYDEDSNGAENLKSVADVAKKIQNFAAKSQNEIILNTDLTGGMRHINMMMLDIIRLLEYSGVKIGKIIYSNYNPQKKVGTVEEVKNIYDLFQLISGVEEFINFGSVKVLKDYYKNQKEKSAALKNLLDKMENFAEAIKLCRYGQFKTAIEKLHDAINDFSADENNLNDVLMARLIERIKREYSMLIATRGQDDLKIIRWCVEKGYLQQALTLYTERVPEYIGEHFIAQTEKNAQDLEKRISCDDMHRNKYFYLLNVVENSGGEKNFSKALRVFATELKDTALIKILKGKFSFDDWFGNLNERLKKFEMICAEEKQLRKILRTFTDLQKNDALLSNLNDDALTPIKNIIDVVADELRQMPNTKLRKKKIFDFVQREITAEALPNYFPSPATYSAFEKKYPKSYRLHGIISQKYFSLVNLSEDEFLNVMDRYFRLKDERNHSNHARNDIGEFGTAKDLEQCILDGLAEIEKITEN